MKLYYVPPSDEIFENMKTHALLLWQAIANNPSYYEEKTTRLKSRTNIGENFMYTLAEFDEGNQQRLMQHLRPDTRQAVVDRLLSVDYTGDLI